MYLETGYFTNSKLTPLVYMARYVCSMGYQTTAPNEYNYHVSSLYPSPNGPMNPDVYEIFPVVATSSGKMMWTPYGSIET